MKSIVLSVVATVVMVQAWSTFSWMVLPWHHADYRAFKDGEAVSKVVQEQAQGDGIYMLPNFDAVKQQTQEGRDSWFADAHRGPFAFMTVRPGGSSGDMNTSMALMAVLNLGLAVVLAIVYTSLSATTLLGKALLLGLVGGLGGVFPHLSQLLWWEFPALYSVAGAIDGLVTWTLGGLVMAKVRGV